MLDADPKPPNISIAYDRVEGYFGPRYDNGAAPPVFASIRSDGAVFNPKIQQLYATGHAAEILGGVTPDKNKSKDLKGGKKVMFFGTATSTGLKVDFAENGVPNGILFGYRRKEVSFIPVGTHKGVDTYASVIGSIDTTGKVGIRNAAQGDAAGANLKSEQFFATGRAAEALAPELVTAFQLRAKEAVGGASTRLPVCYVTVTPEMKPLVWDDADHYKLLAPQDLTKPSKTRALLAKAFKDAIKKKDAAKLARLDRRYMTRITLPDRRDPNRAQKLEAHTAFVCGLSRSNQAAK